MPAIVTVVASAFTFARFGALGDGHHATSARRVRSVAGSHMCHPLEWTQPLHAMWGDGAFGRPPMG